MRYRVYALTPMLLVELLRRMTLHRKSVLVILVATAIVALASLVIAKIVLMPGLLAYEQHSMQERLETLSASLTHAVGDLDGTAADYAMWDRTFEFMQHGGSSYEHAAFNETSFKNYDIQIVMLLRLDDTVALQKVFLARDETPIGPDDAAAITRVAHDFMPTVRDDVPVRGIVAAPSAPFYVVMRPILPSSGKGASAGMIVMARRIDENEIDDMEQLTHTTVRVVVPYGSSLIAPDAAHLNLAHGAEAWVERTKSIISGELLVRDVKGSPALFLRLSTDRALYQRSRRLIWGACLLLAFLAVILGLGNLWFLHALILSRLRRASRLVAHITSADDLNVRIPITRLDELGRLAQAVNTMLDELQRSHNELLATHAAAEFDAMHDALTGLKNRRAILISAQMEVTRAAREHSKTAVLLADIDHFKKINDTYGHPVGDSVLISVATALESELRPYDSAGRYGGEEFLIVVPGVNYVRAMEVAERVRVKVEDSVRLDADGSGRVTISIGVAVTNGEQPLDHVIAAADMALYDAKSHGRNCVKIAEPRMHVEPELPDSVPQLVERSYSGA